MNPRPIFFLLAGGFALAAASCSLRAEDKAHKLTTVSTRKMADSLHAIIAADQQAYAELVAKTNGAAAEKLPPHAQVLRQAAQAIQKKGAEFSYTLRSLSPINPNNGPQTGGEQAGLEFVAKHPDEAFYTEEELGGRSYFTAVYAERATLASCIDCHNTQAGSPRRDWKAGDVMGAVVVRVPLEF